ncbi:fumarylacetoacetate hydrolase family protein [Sphingobium sp.]|uniref:fumarylacetoacetate hydrolase family protein n=1 Tax=Sphingobium sp. TaxID=1912891 RepID=UPI0028BF2557|nr:fumarylacetoacetate hydrolase family protein [Sphingobium sp.]
MRLISYLKDETPGLALARGDQYLDLAPVDPSLPTDVGALLKLDDWKDRVERAAQSASTLDLSAIRYLPPIRTGEKILCVGLNYLKHVGESPYEVPKYPVFFPRFSSTLIGHEAPLIKPFVSNELDFEAEMVAVIGRTGRHIAEQDALDHVAGYTLFNEASVRDYQFFSPQWTMGKNFDNTGACGPEFVSADELPAGAKGLKIEMHVNGKVEQSANTDDLMFPVAKLVSLASVVMTLRPGDMIVTGTPAGVRYGWKPPVYLNAGDVCEVSVENIGVLRNTVADETR